MLRPLLGSITPLVMGFSRSPCSTCSSCLRGHEAAIIPVKVACYPGEAAACHPCEAACHPVEAACHPGEAVCPQGLAISGGIFFPKKERKNLLLELEK